MKRSFLLLSLFFAISCAYAAQLPFSTGPAVPQTYQSANGAQSSATPIVTSQDNNGAAMIASANNTPSVAAAASNNDNSSTNTVAQTEQQIQTLAENEGALNMAVQTVEENIVQLQKTVGALQSHATEHSTSMPALLSEHADVILSLTIVVAAGLLLTMGMMIGKHRTRSQDFVWKNTGKNATQAEAVLEDDVKNEFDFMSTAEAIPAKLNLARSYLAMRDWQQAGDILKVIVENGNDAQQQEAKLLMQHMESNVS